MGALVAASAPVVTIRGNRRVCSFFKELCCPWVPVRGVTLSLGQVILSTSRKVWNWPKKENFIQESSKRRNLRHLSRLLGAVLVQCAGGGHHVTTRQNHSHPRKHFSRMFAEFIRTAYFLFIVVFSNKGAGGRVVSQRTVSERAHGGAIVLGV